MVRLISSGMGRPKQMRAREKRGRVYLKFLEEMFSGSYKKQEASPLDMPSACKSKLLPDLNNLCGLIIFLLLTHFIALEFLNHPELWVGYGLGYR